MATSTEAIFDRRLLIVTGKGGVGKSVVAAALAQLASRRSKNVLLVEVDTQDRLGALFETGPVGDKIAPLRENISGIDLSPRTILEDYFRTHIRVRAVYGPILASRVFNRLFESAPALKELVCLGKLWRLVEDKPWWSSRFRWDLVILDAPATGHGLGFLDVPESASHILLGGMKSNALRVRDMLRDPQVTALNIVTLPEEMPVNEAVMLADGARDQLKIPLGFLFLNSVFPERLSSEDAAVVESLPRETLATATRAAFGQESAGPALAAAVHYERERVELSSRYRKEVRDRIDLPAIEIPHIFSGSFGLAEIDRVAAVIEDQMRSPAPARVPA